MTALVDSGHVSPESTFPSITSTSEIYATHPRHSVTNRMLYPTRKCVLGLNGPRIEVGAVQEIAESI